VAAAAVLCVCVVSWCVPVLCVFFPVLCVSVSVDRSNEQTNQQALGVITERGQQQAAVAHTAAQACGSACGLHWQHSEYHLVVVSAYAVVHYSLIISVITALQQAHTQLYEGDTLGGEGLIQLLSPMNKLLIIHHATAGVHALRLLCHAVRVHVLVAYTIVGDMTGVGALLLLAVLSIDQLGTGCHIRLMSHYD
jgi:hypothetical protein